MWIILTYIMIFFVTLLALIDMAPERHAVKDDGVKDYKWDIYWPNVILLAFIHLGALYGLMLRSEVKTLSDTFLKLSIILNGYGVTAGMHRLWSHRCFKAKIPAQIFLLFLASTCYQNSVYIWCRDHRMHHKYTETDSDPHNAKRGFFFSHIGWLMVRKHPDVQKMKHTVDMSDLEADPLVMFQHRYYYYIVTLCTVVYHMFIPMYFFGESLKVAFFRVMLYRLTIVLHFTWSINSFAHLYGHRPYNKEINPVECKIMNHIHIGEQFHNYHHSFPWDYKTAELSSDARNSTTMLIDLMAFLGLVYDRRTTSVKLIDAKMNGKGDGSIDKDVWFFSKCLPKSFEMAWKHTYNLTLFSLFIYSL